MAADRQLYIEIVVDDKGAVKKLSEISAGVENISKKAKPASADVGLFESAMLKASTVGTILGNALYDLGSRAVGTLVGVFKSAITESNNLQSAFLGLSSLATTFGVDADEAKKAAQSLASDGLMTVGESAAGLKNLLASGFGLPEAINLMAGFKDSAAFNRQASLGFGQAVVSATEGIKNQNSILIDNAGITKNYSVIAKEAGLSVTDLAKISTDAGVRQKIYTGLLKETGIFLGNAEQATQTYTGAVSKLSTAWTTYKASIGDAVTKNETVVTAINLISEALTGVQGDSEDTSKALAVLVSKAVILLFDLAKGAIDSAQVIYQAYHEAVRLIDLDFQALFRSVVGYFDTTLMTIAAMQAVMVKFKIPHAEENLATLLAMRAALVKSGETTDVYSATLGKMSTRLGEIRAQLEGTIGKFIEVGEGAKGGGKKLTAAAEDTSKFGKSIKELTKELVGFKNLSDDDFVKEFAAKLHDAERGATQLKRPLSELPDILQAAIERLRQLDLAEVLRDGAKQAREEMERIAKDWQEQVNTYVKYNTELIEENLNAWVEASQAADELVAQRTLSSFEHQLATIEREGQAKKDALDKHGAFYNEALAAIERETREKMAAARKAHNDQVFEMSKAVTSWSNTWRGLLNGIPGLLQQAFTGGGGIKGAIDAITSEAGKGIMENLFFGGKEAGPLNGVLTKGVKKVSDWFGNAAGDMLAGAIPVVGSMMGPLISKGIGMLGAGFKKLLNWGGPSKEELEGRETIKKFEESLHGLLNTQQKLEAGNEKWKLTTIAVRDAYLATGRSAAEAEADVKALWDSSKKGAEEVKAATDKINEAFREQEADAKRLTAAIEKYGFTIEELGPQLRRQKLDEQAKELIEDWRVLIASGIDMATVNTRMADTVNQYIQSAVKAGVEIPFAMRPILQTMLEQGTLVDANGEKITDFKTAGITFAETMTQGFDRIVLKLDELIQRLIGAGTAIENLPSEKVIDVKARLSTEGGEEGSGSIWDRITDRNNWATMHKGGPMLRRAHTGLAIDEVPLIGQVGEGVVSRRGMRALGGESGLHAINNGGRGGGLTVSVNGNIVVTGTQDEAELERRVGAAIVRRMKKQGVRFNA